MVSIHHFLFQTDPSENEALLRAAEQGDLVQIKILFSDSEGLPPSVDLALKRAARHGHLSVVQFLVQQGVDLHTDEEWALRLASKYNHLSVVQWLVSQGADVHARNDEALQWATENGSLPMVQFLIQAEADILWGIRVTNQKNYRYPNLASRHQCLEWMMNLQRVRQEKESLNLEVSSMELPFNSKKRM